MNIGNETEQIEFKKSTSELKEGIISIASILNKHGKGTLYFGVNNHGDVIGQEIGKDTLRYVSRDISGNISPACWYTVEERKCGEDLRFIEVTFSGENAPYSAYGRYYERFADEDRIISDLELERLFISRRKDYSEWENKETEYLISDIDENLFKQKIESGKEASRIRYIKYNNEELLSKLGLLSKDKRYLNNAGRILFSGSGPIVLKLATFAGNTKETFIKLNHYEGNIFECIDEGINYISEGINWDIEISGRAARKEKPEIPLVAIREIVINAFAHGKYNDNTTFEINVFKDRVVVYSPGAFPIGYTPEDFASHAQEPIMLNPKIVNVLFKTATIESFGSGFSRAFSSCEKEGVTYNYENSKSGFRFTFFRPIGHQNVQEMSKTQREVYELIKSNNMATAKIISKSIGKTEKTVYRAISALKGLGLIEREGDDYNGRWKCIS